MFGFDTSPAAQPWPPRRHARLFVILTFAVTALACSSGTACAPIRSEPPDTASLLQFARAREPARQPSEIADAYTGLVKPSNLSFEFWEVAGGRSGVLLRVMVPTQVGSRTYSLSLDTGSSSLAFCNGTENVKGAQVPPAQPLPVGSSANLNQCITYGAGSTEYFGPTFHGAVTFGPVTAQILYAVMSYEKGTLCGIPTNISQSASGGGATRKEGIFGFAGTGFNLVCDAKISSCNECQGQLQTANAPFMAVLEKLSMKVFGIEWAPPLSNLVGPSTGALYIGLSAKKRQSAYRLAYSTIVPGTMVWNGLYYNILTYGYTAFGPSGEVLAGLPFSDFHPSVGLVDTGTPSIELPESTYNALQTHFSKLNAKPATVRIFLQSYVEGGAYLELVISQGLFFTNGIFLKTASAHGATLGLPLWIFYQYVQFDIEAQSFSFVRRTSRIADFQQKVVDIVEKSDGPV